MEYTLNNCPVFRDHLKEPLIIRDRLELIRLLREETEVENSLFLQYLYAYFSLKDSEHFSKLRGVS